MKMIFKTKMRYNAGSMITVIPSALVKLLELEHGDTLNWESNITENGVTITVIPEKKE